MSEKKLNLPLFNKHKELAQKQNEYRILQDELINLTLKTDSIPLEQNKEKIKQSHSNICVYLQKINARKATMLLKFQEEDKKLENDKSNIIPPLKNHKDLQIVIESKEEIDSLLANLQDAENINILELVQTFPVDTSSMKNKQLANDISKFRTMEDMYNSIVNIECNDQNSTLQDKTNNSDLGCYPYEDNSVDFMTSSPILRVESNKMFLTTSQNSNSNSALTTMLQL